MRRIELETLRIALCAAAALLGLGVIAAWYLDLAAVKTVLPGFTTMKYNTAVGLVLGAVGCATIRPPVRGVLRTIAVASAALLLTLALATLAEYAFQLRLGIDEALVNDPATTSRPYPGRMSPVTAIGFVSTALSLFTLVFGTSRRVLRIGHILAAIPLAITYLAFVDYAYGVDSLYNFGRFVAVAIHTALGLGLITAAILLTRLREGWGASFINRPITVSILVRLLILAVLVPFATGQLVVMGVRLDYYQPLFASALFSVVAAAAYAFLAFQSAFMVRGAERAVQRARDEIDLKNAALATSEEQFRTFAQAMPNHVWAATGTGELYWFNEQVLAYSGGSQDDLLAFKWVNILHPDDIDAAAQVWGDAIASGAGYETQFRIRNVNGSYRWFLARAAPIRSPSGEIVRWIGTNTDIHEQKLAAARIAELNATLEQRVEERTRDLQQSQAKARAYFDTSPEYLLLVRVGDNASATFEDINAAAEKAFQRKSTQIIGRPVADVMPPDSAGDIERHALACLASGERQTYSVRRTYVADHHILIDASVSLIERDQQGGGLLLFSGRDVTEQRRTEEALRQSQKMEAVGQLTGGLAHDFNNMLAGITGSLELMSLRLEQRRYGDIERYVGIAQSAAKRAAALTHRLLAFARRQTLEPRAADINRIVAGMEEMVRRTVGPGVRLETVAAGGLWTTLVDPGQLENALLNLCINARDAMPDGGHLTIETGNRWLDERAGKERELEPGQYVTLCVSDNGCGMEPDVVERAFDPFFTTKPIGQGTGLGLSMVYGFAKQSGGHCRIYSEPGQGTMICLYLPRHGGEADAHEELTATAATQQAAPGETVLIVDDEPTVRMLVLEVLEDLGYAAMEAADGAAGLRILQSEARIDLLVTDVGLPGAMNGRQMADAARRTRPDLKVLFITGYAENAVLSHGHLDAGMHVLTKPFAMSILGRRMKDLIEAPR